MVEIFVEGITDERFIRDYIVYLGIDKGIIITPMKNGLSDLLSAGTARIIEQNTVQGIQNILIVDADKDFEKRKLEVERFIQEHKLQASFFLLPNHQSIGDLETLLIEIINKKNIYIFECFDAYELCIDGKGYKLPDKKAKVFAYVEALSDKNNAKSQKRDYLNTEYWDLDSPFLDDLKKFLLKYKS